MSNNQYLVEASTSRCKKQPKRTTSSNHMFKDDVNSRRRKAEIQQLERRLQVLEEESETLKGALSETVKESKKLITEIHQHFNTIRSCLLKRQVESYSHGIQIISLLKEDRRDGLLQVLCQDSNPSIVKRGF